MHIKNKEIFINMAELNEQRKKTRARLIIPTDVPLWGYLVKGTPKADRLSRVQAFYDLTQRRGRGHLCNNAGLGKQMGMEQGDGDKVHRQSRTARRTHR